MTRLKLETGCQVPLYAGGDTSLQWFPAILACMPLLNLYSFFHTHTHIYICFMIMTYDLCLMVNILSRLQLRRLFWNKAIAGMNFRVSMCYPGREIGSLV